MSDYPPIGTGPDAPRVQTLYASHKHYAVLDGPAQSGVMSPPQLGGGGGIAQMQPPLVYLGPVTDVLTVVFGYHPTLKARTTEIAERLGVTREVLQEWFDCETDPHYVLEPAGWWELLKMRAEAWPAYDREAQDRLAARMGGRRF